MAIINDGAIPDPQAGGIDVDPQQITDATHDAFEYDGRADQRYCKIGVVELSVPPVAIQVSDVYTNVAQSYPIRSKTATKRTVGQRRRRVVMTIMFTENDALWDGPSSLRTFVAQFRCAPFVPVVNDYLNNVYGIDALALESMSISTVPEYPSTAQVTLVAYAFNWKAFLPLPGTFGGNGTRQDPGAIDWDLFGYYVARGVKQLDRAAPRPLFSSVQTEFADWSKSGLEEFDAIQEKALEAKLGPVVDDGLKRLEVYYSDRDFSSLLWLSKLGPRLVADPDVKPSDVLKDWRALGDAFIAALGLGFLSGSADIDQVASNFVSGLKKSIEEMSTSESAFARQYNAFLTIASLGEFFLTGRLSASAQAKVDAAFKAEIEALQKAMPSLDQEVMRKIAAYRTAVHDDIWASVLDDEAILKLFEEMNVGWVHEWEIPMRRMGLGNKDLFETVIVDSITVETANALAFLPLEGHIEPACQFVGGRGTTAVVSMTVVGERAIKHIREVFDRVCMSSGKNREHGVTGFLGVKNEVLSLAGMRYALLDSFQVDTVPGFPHVFTVTMRLSDFDILQQKREMVDPVERIAMIEDTKIGHPILRFRQAISRTNAYPDLPLPRIKHRVVGTMPTTAEMILAGKEIRAEERIVPGRYLDPDFYFKSLSMVAEEQQTATIGDDAYTVPAPSTLSTPTVFEPEGHTIVSKFRFKTGLENGKIVPKLTVVPGADDDDETKQALGVDTIEAQTVEVARSDPFAAIAEIASDDETDPASIPRSLLDKIRRIYGNDEAANAAFMIGESLDRAEPGLGRAFPTYMVYLIDEGGTFLGYRLFDTFYGIQAAISLDVLTDKDATLDTAVLTFSNVYRKLATPQWYDAYSMPLFLQNLYRAIDAQRARVFGIVDSIEALQIAPGMRMQVRMGYSANPDALPIVFNGTVVEVNDGEALTVVVQGDGAELDRMHPRDAVSSRTTISPLLGFLLGTGCAEPQDLIIRYLTAGTSITKEIWQDASMGLIPSSSNPGLYHFGGYLFDTQAFGDDAGFAEWKQRTFKRIATRVKARLAAAAKNDDSPRGWFNAALKTVGAVGSFGGDVFSIIGKTLDLSRDYEILKRNIYPANRTGIRGFRRPQAVRWGDVMNVLGLLGNKALEAIAPEASVSAASQRLSDDERGPLDERSIHINTGGRTMWEVFKLVAAIEPNYVLGVRPFEHRSTLFFGKQAWLYTSGVVPLYDAEALRAIDVASLKSALEADPVITAIDESAVYVEENPTLLVPNAEYVGGYGIWIGRGMDVVLKHVFEHDGCAQAFGEHVLDDDDRARGVQPAQAWDELVAFADAHPTLLYVLMVEFLNTAYHGTDLGMLAEEAAKGVLPDWTDAVINAMLPTISAAGFSRIAAIRACVKRIKRGDGTAWSQIKAIAAEIVQEAPSRYQTFLVKNWVVIDDANIAAAIDDIANETPAQYPFPGSADEASASRADEHKGIVQALVGFAGLLAGGLETLLDTSKANTALALGMWESVNDSTYYGLADTDDLLAADGYAPESQDAKDVLAGAGPNEDFLAKRDPFLGITMRQYLAATAEQREKLKLLKRRMVAADNPFSREFGEPVLEVREPFARIHYLSDASAIIDNSVYADGTQVANQVRALAHTSGQGKGNREAVIKADVSIGPKDIVERIYDSGLNFDAFTPTDTVRLKNAGRAALKESLQTMYGGGLLIIGDPSIRPFDYIFVMDLVSRMAGWCEAKRVTHRFDAETGFVTTVEVAPIVAVDDALVYSALFGASAFAMDHVLREHAVRAVATAMSSPEQIDAETLEDVFARYRRGFPGTSGDPSSIKVQAIANAAGMINNILLAGEAGAIGAGGGVGAAGVAAAGGPAAAGAALGAVVAAIACGYGAIRLYDWLATSEPIEVMLLMKDGKPLHAGLNGADGIMVGQPEDVPLLEHLGVHVPADDPLAFWNRLGFSAAQAKMFKEAESLARRAALERAQRTSGRIEAGYVADVPLWVAVEAEVGYAYDADTVYLKAPVAGTGTAADGGSLAVRLLGIDAPEKGDKPADDIGSFAAMSTERRQFGAGVTARWLQRRLGIGGEPGRYSKKVWLVINKANPVDAHGRILAYIVDERSCRDLSKRHLESPAFSWMTESINGEMLTDPETRDWVVPYLFLPGLPIASEPYDVGDRTFRIPPT